LPGTADHEAMEATLRMAPPPLDARTGANARTTDNAPQKFTSISARTASRSPSRVDPRNSPALLTRRSTSAAASAAADTESGSVTSRARGRTPSSVSDPGSRAVA
jgi:hypothetical protein